MAPRAVLTNRPAILSWGRQKNAAGGINVAADQRIIIERHAFQKNDTKSRCFDN
jgi:hypothetical protein